MKRIKNLGLAVVAVLALTAVVGVAGASASGFLAEKYPAAVTTSKTSQELKFHSLTARCYPAPEAELTGASSAIEGVTNDSLCESFGNTTMKMNSCKFVYRPGAETSKGVFAGTFDIVCPAGLAIQIATICGPITVGSQSGLAATYENIGTGANRSVTINAKASGLQHTQGGAGGCASGTYADGVWNGSWTVQAAKGGSQVGMFVGNNPISITGSPPKLTAGAYPVSLTAAQSGGLHKLVLAGGTTECTTANFSSNASAATAQFAIQAEYAGCTVLGVAGSVSMHGCTYVFNVLNQEPAGSTYAGHADIACPAGKAIELIAGTSKVKCTVTIPAQTTDSEGLAFTNGASTIALGLSMKGIDYHQQKGEGLGACVTGDFTTGTYTGSSTLVGGF